MDEVDLIQQVTDLLAGALEIAEMNHPDSAMLNCRKATEAIVHYLHYKENGQFPQPDKNGRYPSIMALLYESMPALPPIAITTIESINAQTRSSIHWDEKNQGKLAQKRHVLSVVENIKNTVLDIFETPIELNGVVIDKGKLSDLVQISMESTLLGVELDHHGENVVITGISADEQQMVANSSQMIDELGVSLSYQDCIKLATIIKSQGEVNQAIDRLNNTIEMIPSNDFTHLIMCSNLLAMWYNEIGQDKLALIQYNDALRAAQKSEDAILIAQCYGNLGQCYVRIFDHKKALEHYEISLKFFREIGFEHSIAVSLVHIAEIKVKQNEIKTSYDYCNEANEIFTKLGDYRLMAYTTDLMGTILQISNKNQSLNCHRIALRMYNELVENPDLFDITRCQINIGIRLIDLGQFQEAIIELISTIKRSDEINWIQGSCLGRISIASCYIDQNEFNLAEARLSEAELLAEESHDTAGRINSKITRTKMLYKKGDFAKAKFEIEVAILMMNNSGMRLNLENAKSLLRKINENL